MSDAGTYVDELLSGTYERPLPVDINVTIDFVAAVSTLTNAGVPRASAVELINQVVTRGEPLDQWARHLVRVRNEGAKVWSW